MANNKLKTIRERGGRRGLVPSREFAKKDVAYNNYLDGLDPENRKDIQLALALCPDPRFRRFLEYMGRHVGKTRVSLAANAKACDIGLEEFNDWFQKASTQKAIALFQVQSADLTNQMIELSKNRKVGCERCDGLGWIEAEEGLPGDTPGYRIRRVIEKTDINGDVTDEKVLWQRDCPAGCDHGKVLKGGDDFRLAKVLEMAGLINQKSGGIAIVQNFNGQGMGMASARLNNVMTVDVEPE